MSVHATRRSSAHKARRRKPRGALLLALIAIVVMAMLAALMLLERRSEEARSSQALMQQAQLGLYHLHTSMSDFISSSSDPVHGGPGTVDAASLRASNAFAALPAHGTVSDVGAAQNDFRTYLGDVAEAISLADHGFVFQAGQLFSTQAGPAFDTVQASLTRAVEEYQARATAAELFREIGSLATLLFGGLILGFVVHHAQRQRSKLATAGSREAALRDSERRFLALMDSSPDLVLVLADDGSVRFQSGTASGVLGREHDELVGASFVDFLDPRSAEDLPDLIARARANPATRQLVEWRLRGTDGSMVDVEAILVSRFEDPDIQGLVINMRDISERLALEEAIRYRAFHDELTGLANRSLLEDRTAHALDRSARTGRSVCVLLVDIDDFSDVNDSFGHQIGDQLLLQVSQRLGRCIRSQDTLARVDGDTFAILIEVDDELEAAGLAQRLLSSLEDPVSLDDIQLFVHARIGITTASGAGPGVVASDRGRNLLVEADLAMNEAKHQTQGKIGFYAASMQIDVDERIAMRSDLQRGLARNEFILQYQPIVALDSGSFVGAEALVRWRHPERGMVPPAAFIPTAEQTGLIKELGGWVMKTACAEAASWPDLSGAGPPLYVSVNVAAQQLLEPGFVSDVRHALEEARLDPRRLVLEVTETVLIEGHNETTLGELQEMGVRLAIDDFGTGYSSLSYLRQFNMDVLKIDKSFVDHLGTRAKDGALVAAMVGIGTAMGMHVVAEGIEHAEQVGELLALGCELGQGYLFSRPVDPEVLRAMLDLRCPVPM